LSALAGSVLLGWSIDLASSVPYAGTTNPMNRFSYFQQGIGWISDMETASIAFVTSLSTTALDKGADEPDDGS
jgi:hypothetical protein